MTMRKLELHERKELIQVFQNPTSAIILASLYKDIGEAWMDENHNRIILVENSFYIDGQLPDKELMDFVMKQVLRKELNLFYIIPQNIEMSTYCDKYYNQDNDQYSIIKSERHLMDIDMNKISQDTLMNFISDLPEQYQLKPITEELFYTARNTDKYLNNFISLFHDYDDFEKEGYGYFILDGSDIIAGISSYARYKDGVEVQIAVKPEYRGQHLARSLGATFILESKKRGLYPWWDCANPTSEHIAMELGYVLKQVNPIYKYLMKR
ncbi:GNAT family N-acetyltransferase [Anaeromicropila herbilytica]|uniref:N-acetyltransferase domain-containing protein n=1 Tax=Anaeromicropila herbilytica TaxID=2785025 RepID=A0A7R7EHY4_9FIRM|nr:GNAT family N-acetyltransferase [Anaeromicropila herbilytica]BCN29070.1 hypothetical protein bsdtb5_03650 [Anaeromicropila herbilytica]